MIAVEVYKKEYITDDKGIVIGGKDDLVSRYAVTVRSSRDIPFRFLKSIDIIIHASTAMTFKGYFRYY